MIIRSVRVLHNGVYNFNRIENTRRFGHCHIRFKRPSGRCENEIRLSDAGLFRFDVHDRTPLAIAHAIRVFEGQGGATRERDQRLRAGRP